jgi:hypothetical protein
MTAPLQAVPDAAALFCTECGRELPGPGEACPACPQLDARRRAVVARYSGQVTELRAIDADENRKALQDAAGRARALVTPVHAAAKTAEAAVTAAIAAEREAADRFRGARSHLRKVTRAEERARRDQAGVKALTKAIMRKRAAADVTEEVRQAAEQAARAREAAEQSRDHHLVRLAVLEDEAVAAERAAENPPERVPPSVWTCLLGNPLALLMQPDLGAEGRALVAAQVANLAKLAGVTEELRAEGRAAAEAERADRGRSPAFLQPLGPGHLAAVPNPAHPGPPRQAGTPGGWA